MKNVPKLAGNDLEIKERKKQNNAQPKTKKKE